MWLFTTVGFFSIVRAEQRDLEDLRKQQLIKNDDIFSVRARVREDLEGLMKALDLHRRIIEIPGRDYPYRIVVTKEILPDILMFMGSQITYTNFKDEVKKKQGPDRAHLYLSVWGAMNGAERKLEIEKEHRTKPRKRGRFDSQSRPQSNTLADWADIIGGDRTDPGPGDGDAPEKPARGPDDHARLARPQGAVPVVEHVRRPRGKS